MLVYNQNILRSSLKIFRKFSENLKCSYNLEMVYGESLKIFENLQKTANSVNPIQEHDFNSQAHLLAKLC